MLSLYEFLKNSNSSTFKKIFGPRGHLIDYSYTYLTLYNAILRIARNFLETRESIKISTHPFYHVNLDWFSWEWSKKKIFFLKKKSKMAVFQKWPFFKIANSQNFFVKISQIRPWVCRIAWCEGHWSGLTYMVVRLSDISSKIAEKHKKSIFSLF